jgi:hypothetical protein
MFQDHKDLLSAFNVRGVKYLIVAVMQSPFMRSPALPKILTCSSRLMRRMQRPPMMPSPALGCRWEISG